MEGAGPDRDATVIPSDLLFAEDAGWRELHELMDSLTEEEAERPGYYAEGWSAKDALAHVGTWLAEAGVILERIAVGTFHPEEIEVDAMNQAFIEAMRDVAYRTVRAQAHAARTRMLWALGFLPELTPDAVFWIRKSGPEHYDEHLPRLREWVVELRSG